MMERVTGIGGIFFKAQNPKELKAWYVQHLGLPTDEYGNTMLQWREWKAAEKSASTVWETFAADTAYFAPSTAPFMLNYRVANLDGLLAKLREEGVAVEEKIQEEPYGRFAWLMDPENNRIELWEPAAEEETASPQSFVNRVLPETVFNDVNLERATFENINLTGSTFRDVSLRGAKFSDINFAGTLIEDACIDGLTINGWDVLALIQAEEARRKSAETTPA